jgi:3-hydroxybutyrate dehydrogenase
MDDRFLTGRSALVTGSTSGIGLAIASALARAGARVAINGLGDAAQVDAAIARVDEAGDGGTRHFPADLREPSAIAAMMDALAAEGAPDILVNNAGVQHAAALADMPAERWDAILAINLSAAFHAMRAALPGMAGRGYGRVVNIASVHGLVASVHKAPYVASKFGLVGLSKVAALEYAPAGDRDSGGVTVNCICPGWVETPLIEPQIVARQAGGSREDGVRSLLAEKQPSLRMSLPEDIAALAVWLCGARPTT